MKTNNFERVRVFGNQDGLTINMFEQGKKIWHQFITGDDLLDYTMEELTDVTDIMTEAEKRFFISEYNRVKGIAVHKPFYDAYDNTWKDEETY